MFELKRFDKKPTKVLIVAKQNRAGLRMGRVLEKKLQGKVDIAFEPTTARKYRKLGTSIKKFDGDLVITLGGDGTFLRAAHQTHLPILPIKLEGHGFLCTCTFSEFSDNLQRIFDGKFDIFDRMRLSCTRTGDKRRFDRYVHRIKRETYPLAVNEIAFARKRPSKVLEVEIIIDDVKFDYIGDGVMISTPAGSTAYNSSAGGSLIDPDLDVISITALYPFYSKLKPMIVPSGKRIEILVKGDCALVIDGHGGDYIKRDGRFIIERSHPSKVVHLINQNFYQKFKNEFL
ncbi:NAD(+)/NADH kinase [Candidatus Aenigmatarchaeota archaeon]